MSVEAILWVIKNPEIGTPADTLVMMALANFANERHESYPSLATITSISRLDKATVCRRLAELEERGLLKRKPRSTKSGKATSTVYMLPIPIEEVVQPKKPKRNRSGAVAPRDSHLSHHATDPVAPCDSLIDEPCFEPRRENQEEELSLFRGLRPPEPPETQPDDPPPEGWGYTSSDDTVSFTADEIARLGIKFYSFPKIYGQIRNIAESTWLAGVRPPDRKKAIINRLQKLHDNRVSKINAPPDPRAEREAREAQVAADKADIRDYFERARS